MDAESKEPTPIEANLQLVLDRLTRETLRPEPPPDFEGLVEEDGITYAVIGRKRLQIRPRPEFQRSASLLDWGNKAHTWLTDDEHHEAVQEYDRLEEKEKLEARKRTHTSHDCAAAFSRAWKETFEGLNSRYKNSEISLDQFQEDLAAVVVAHLQVEPGRRSVNRVIDVFRKHGSQATRDGALSLIQDETPVENRLKWLEHRARTSKPIGNTAREKDNDN